MLTFFANKYADRWIEGIVQLAFYAISPGNASELFYNSSVQTVQRSLPFPWADHIGGGAYWAGRAAAAHFLALVGKAYSLPAHFLMFKKSLFHYL